MQAPDSPGRNTCLDRCCRMRSLGRHIACMRSGGYRAYTSLILETEMDLGQGYRMPAPLLPNRNTGWGRCCHMRSPVRCKAHMNSQGCFSYTSLQGLVVKGLVKVLEMDYCRLAPLQPGKNTCLGHHCHRHSLGHRKVYKRSEGCHACTRRWVVVKVGLGVTEVPEEMVVELGQVHTLDPSC